MLSLNTRIIGPLALLPINKESQASWSRYINTAFVTLIAASVLIRFQLTGHLHLTSIRDFLATRILTTVSSLLSICILTHTWYKDRQYLTDSLHQFVESYFVRIVLSLVTFPILLVVYMFNGSLFTTIQSVFAFLLRVLYLTIMRDLYSDYKFLNYTLRHYVVLLGYGVLVLWYSYKLFTRILLTGNFEALYLMGLLDFGMDLDLLQADYVFSPNLSYLHYTTLGQRLDMWYRSYTIHCEASVPLSDALSVLDNKASYGNLMVSSFIDKIRRTNQLPFELRLSRNGISYSNILIKMINHLHSVESSFQGDNLLLDFANTNFPSEFKYWFEVQDGKIVPSLQYSMRSIRIKESIFKEAGVYCLSHKLTDSMNVGSSIHFRSRFKDHVNTLKGGRVPHAFHTMAILNGGIDSVEWSPLISMPGLFSSWTYRNANQTLSLGGSKLLLGLSQFPIRIMEQNLLSEFSSLYNKSYDIPFFNFAMNLSEFTLEKGEGLTYLVLDESRKTVLLELDSLNSVAKFTGKSITTVRNNLDWHKPVEMVIDGVTLNGFYSIEGNPIRTVPNLRTVSPTLRYSELSLNGRTLYDLLPGKYYVINPATLEDSYIFDSLDDLCRTLNPFEDFDKLTPKRRTSRYGDRVLKFLNLNKPNSNELGTFYYAAHPNWLPSKGAHSATPVGPYFLIYLVSGCCTFHKSLRSLNPTKIQRINDTIKTRVPYLGRLVMFSNEFVSMFPDAEPTKGRSYQLTDDELSLLKSKFV